MLPDLKKQMWNAIPGRYQVPTYYRYSIARGYLEREMTLLELMVRDGDHVIDVGGNRGTYAYRLWSLGARVDVFEPNPLYLIPLEQWAANKPGVAIHAVALSSRPGGAQLHIPVDERGIEHSSSGSIETSSDRQSRLQPVVLRTLDSYGFKDTRLIKIDVEGHEYAVIEGAAQTLAASRPVLIVEIEQRHMGRPIADVFAQILSFGYKGFFLSDAKLRSLSSFNLARHQSAHSFVLKQSYYNNFIFLHKNELASGRYQILAERWM